jgi:hypothetical protein
MKWRFYCPIFASIVCTTAIAQLTGIESTGSSSAVSIANLGSKIPWAAFTYIDAKAVDASKKHVARVGQAIDDVLISLTALNAVETAKPTTAPELAAWQAQVAIFKARTAQSMAQLLIMIPRQGETISRDDLTILVNTLRACDQALVAIIADPKTLLEESEAASVHLTAVDGLIGIYGTMLSITDPSHIPSTSTIRQIASQPNRTAPLLNYDPHSTIDDVLKMLRSSVNPGN